MNGEQVTYRFRGSLFGAEDTYTVTDTTLSGPFGVVLLDRVASLRLYDVPGMRSAAYGTVALASRRCTIRLRDRRKIVLTDQHFLGLGRFENRAATYVPFVRVLVANLAHRAGTELYAGMPKLLWWFWLVTFGILTVALGTATLSLAIGLLLGELPWMSVFFMLIAGGGLIGLVQYLRGLWRRRSHRLDPATYKI